MPFFFFKKKEHTLETLNYTNVCVWCIYVYMYHTKASKTIIYHTWGISPFLLSTLSSRIPFTTLKSDWVGAFCISKCWNKSVMHRTIKKYYLNCVNLKRWWIRPKRVYIQTGWFHQFRNLCCRKICIASMLHLKHLMELMTYLVY